MLTKREIYEMLGIYAALVFVVGLLAIMAGVSDLTTIIKLICLMSAIVIFSVTIFWIGIRIGHFLMWLVNKLITR